MNPLENKATIAVEQLLKNTFVKTNEEMMNSLLAIMKEGEKEFIKEKGRNMTYLEIRSVWIKLNSFFTMFHLIIN